jgi:exosortase
MTATVTKRHALFLGFTAVLVLALASLWRDFFGFLLSSGLYNYMVLIPVVSVYLLVSSRERVLSQTHYSVIPGLACLAIGAAGLVIGQMHGASLNANDRFSLVGASLVVAWIGGFVGIYGLRSFREAMFPLLFLVLMVPIPSVLLEALIGFLQMGSTEVTQVLFALTGLPVLREGFVFQLPGMAIEVAEQCSGIRSSISLFVTAVLAGHLFLRTGWGKVGLALAVFPISMFKNGVRIVSLSLLGTYVDPRILGSELHRSGGIPFFVVALLLLAPVALGFRKLEQTGQGTRRRAQGEGAKRGNTGTPE